MKTALALGAISALFTLPVSAEGPANHGDPYTPVGWLDVSSAFVRTGQRAQLQWAIQYPKTVHDIVRLDPDTDRIIPKRKTRMEVRVVGAAFQVGRTHTPLGLQARVGGDSNWQSLFYGADSTVQPSEVLLDQVVEAGQSIDFAARAQNGQGGWYSSRNTLSEVSTVQAMTKGDSVPHYVPAYDQGTVESFLTSYIDSENFVTIGPRDVIYLFELYSTNPTSRYFDMQDIVVVVTFHDVPE